MKLDAETLRRKARDVLDANWTGRFTKPAPRLYPHQWNWDSGFVAIGYSHYAPNRAMAELRSLFKGQWRHGMVPQIVFHSPSSTYFPDAKDWRAERSRDAPPTKTSGITQPPIHATAAWAIFENAKRAEGVIPFLEEIYPKLLASHRFLYRYRDPEGIGLAVCVHPWETGIDNSPNWDGPLQALDPKPSELPSFQRKDLDVVASSQRPTERDYRKFVFLMEFYKRLGYDQARMAEESPFRVYDVLFNTVLQKANRDLAKIGALLGHDTSEIESWIQRGDAAFDRRLWSDGEEAYLAYDRVRNAPIRVHTVSCTIPLFASIPDPVKAARLASHSFKSCPFGQKEVCASVPSYDETQPGYQATNYWRGPIWLNVNWMLYTGLKQYGFREDAEKIRLNLLRLAHEVGFREYYHPTEAKGLGSVNFSWSAALVIDLLSEPLPASPSDPPNR